MNEIKQNKLIEINDILLKQSPTPLSLVGGSFLAKPFEYELTCLNDVEIKSDVLLQSCCSIRIGTQHIHAMISKITRDNTGSRITFTLSPNFKKLTHETDNQIFQYQTPEQIIKAVFKKRGLRHFQFKLKHTYQAIPYYVQYQESDFIFLTRLMRENGIYYYFEQHQHYHQMIFIDTFYQQQNMTLDHHQKATVEYRLKKNNIIEKNNIELDQFKQHMIAGKIINDQLITHEFLKINNPFDIRHKINSHNIASLASLYLPPQKIKHGELHRAYVTTPTGKDIHTNNKREIKVRFEWDHYARNNESDSCWIPVRAPIAGKNHGILFTPRRGQQVLIGYLNGDVNQPIAMGCIYNHNQQPPIAANKQTEQSGWQMPTTPSREPGNAIMFDVNAGIKIKAKKDLIYKATDKINFNAKDISINATNNIDFNVKNTCDINAAENIILKVGNSSIKLSNNSINIKAARVELNT